MEIHLSECAHVLGASLQGADALCTSVSTDTRTLEAGALFIALRGPNYNGHDYVAAAMKAGAVGCLIEEDHDTGSLPCIRVPDTKRALQTLAQHRRNQCTLSVVAITGSCGKTTARAMLESILIEHGRPYLASRKSFNNDIGVPLTLCKLRSDDEFALLELGANHPGEIAQLTHLVAPTVAVILNAAPVHLEGFGDLDGVACAKGEIFQGLADDGYAIINADDHYCDFWKRQAGSRPMITFGIEHTADIMATEVKLDDCLQAGFCLHAFSQTAKVRLRFLGEHNVMNALAVAAIACALAIPLATIVSGLQQAGVQSGRLRRYELASDVTLLDDSYNSNPQAMAAAIDLLAQSARPTLLVMGDMGELGPKEEMYHRQVGEQARAHGIGKLLAIGALSKHAVNGFGPGAQHFANCAALIAALQSSLQPGTLVLVKASRKAHLESVVSALKGD